MIRLPQYHRTAHGITTIANLRDLLIQKKKGKTWKMSNTWKPSVMHLCSYPLQTPFGFGFGGSGGNTDLTDPNIQLD